jgi:hypothetical protein
MEVGTWLNRFIWVMYRVSARDVGHPTNVAVQDEPPAAPIVPPTNQNIRFGCQVVCRTERSAVQAVETDITGSGTNTCFFAVF